MMARILNQKGMTLFEVMIGVAIMAMITSILGQASWLATKGRRQIDTRELMYHQARVAMKRIVNDVQMSFIVKPDRNSLRRNVSKFKSGFIGKDSGKDDSLTLTTLSGRRYVSGIKAADQREVGYRLDKLSDNMEERLSKQEQPDNAKRLLRREDQTLDVDIFQGGEEEVLAEGILQFDLQYWDAERKEWVNEWDSTGRVQEDKLPRAVQIRLQFANPFNPKSEPIDFSSIAFLELGPDPIDLTPPTPQQGGAVPGRPPQQLTPPTIINPS